MICGSGSYPDLSIQPAPEELSSGCSFQHVLVPNRVVRKDAGPPLQKPKLDPIHTWSADAKPAPFGIVLVLGTRANGPVLLDGGVATLFWCIAFESWGKSAHIPERSNSATAAEDGCDRSRDRVE